MMWEECIKRELVEKRTIDKELARSLLKVSTSRFNFFSSMKISIFVLEGIYESIVELCHAILASVGLKTLSHECAIEFMRKRYLETDEVEFLHKLRKKRHRIKYYGVSFSKDIIKKDMKRGKEVFIKLKSILENEILRN